MNKTAARLLTVGIILACMAAVLAVAGANLGANGTPQSAHPNASIGLAIAALSFVKAAELSR